MEWNVFTGAYNLATLGIFFCVYFLLACLTYGLGVPSGLFVPCILTGATFGRFVGVVVHLAFGNGAVIFFFVNLVFLHTTYLYFRNGLILGNML